VKIEILVSVLASLLGSAPAAAGQARAVMSVTAVVSPACSIELRPSQRQRADIACSTGAAVSTMTAEGHGERPLADAEARLGSPVRRGGAIAFTAPIAPEPAETIADTGLRYLTITY
jgi:hypothetical protein